MIKPLVFVNKDTFNRVASVKNVAKAVKDVNQRLNAYNVLLKHTLLEMELVNVLEAIILLK